MLVLWICTIVGIGVFAVMIYAIITFQKAKGAVPATFTHSTRAEVIWTVIPTLILVFLGYETAPALVRIDDTRNSEMTIKITGYQWKWQYEYVGEGVSFFSTLARDSDAARQTGSGVDPKSIPNYLLEVDRPLVVPEGVKVRVLITAADVIHAWWVPDFGMKKDAIPGFVNEMWFKVDAGKAGFYRGQCAELCGRDHGFMPIVVEVKTKADFASWLEEQKAAAKPAEPATAATPDPNLTTTVAQTP
jgi:cytochrome c oxidase subunit 2